MCFIIFPVENKFLKIFQKHFTSAQKAWTHWPSDDFLNAPVVPPHRPHSATKYDFSQKLTTGAPDPLDNDNSSHNSQHHGPDDSLTIL